MNQTSMIAGKCRHLKGWRPDRPDHRDLLHANFVRAAHIPDHTDLRSFCSPVEDQSDIGSCTANAGTSMMEALAIKMAKPRINFSRLFLYYAERVNIEHGDPKDDSGAQIRDTMKSLAVFGTCAETTWPYDISKFCDKPPEPAWAEAKNHQILSYYRCVGLDGVRQCLSEGFTLEIGFSVPANMESEEVSKTGIVAYPGKDEEMIGGHAVHAVGFLDKMVSGSEKGFVIFQNSWSTDWGDKGFGYLPYRFFTSGLASDFWTVRNEEY